jgi:exoribonuclease II
MEPGRVVAYFENKKILCAVCLDVKENKYFLLTEENREATLGSNRIAHISPHKLKPTQSRDTLVEELKKIAARQRELRESVSIPELWEVVQGEGEEFSLRDLTELAFARQAGGDHEMAVFRALADDRIYFKQKGEVFEARTPEKVEQISIQLQREAEQEREMEEAASWLAEVSAGRPAEPLPHREKVVALLKDMVLQGAEAPDYNRGKTLLQRARIASPEAPFDLLVRLGEWDADENLFLLRYQIPQAFPNKVLEEVDRVLAHSNNGYASRPLDRDLTNLNLFTIDSEFTRDIDDALSLDGTGEDYQVGIHITDVVTFLDAYREIFEEAMNRGTSIYLPDQRIPMISPLLSEGLCSLVAGEKRRALSFLVRMDKDANVREYEIVPSLVQVERRLSYEGVDRMLAEGDEEFALLHEMAENLGRRRKEAGAFFIPRPERVIRVSREKEIQIFKRDRESPSQKMVSEFMILANMLSARFLREKGIPAVYRSQMEPRETVPPMEKFDPLQAHRLRRIMNRVEVSTRPARHAGLGAEAYVTLTSPIRRFYDLLIEQQILRALRGEPILPEREVEKIITTVGPTISKVGHVEDLTEQYWIIRYLEKRIGSTTIGVVLDRFPNKYLVHLNEYMMDVDMPITDRGLVAGDQILVRVEKAHARGGTLKVAPV